MRRSADFDIADRIFVWHQSDSTLQNVFASKSLGEYIRTETLSMSLQDGLPDVDAHVETLNIEGMNLTIGIKRA